MSDQRDYGDECDCDGCRGGLRWKRVASFDDGAFTVESGWTPFGAPTLDDMLRFAEEHKFPRQDEPRPMAGFWSTLTERQQALALVYDGPEGVGRPAVQPEERGTR